MYRQEDFEFFVKGEKRVLTVKHSAKDETLEVLMEKAREFFAGKPFGDSSAFPLTL